MKVQVASSGGGGTKTFSGPPLSISGAGGTFEPPYVSNISTDLTGNVDTVTDQCGYTEVYRSGTVTNWTVDAEGVLGELQLGTLQALAETDDTVNVQTPVLGSRGGEYVIEKCTIQHTDDLNDMEFPYQGDLTYAYPFKISLQSPQAAKDGA